MWPITYAVIILEITFMVEAVVFALYLTQIEYEMRNKNVQTFNHII